MEQSEIDFKNAQIDAFSAWLLENRHMENCHVFKQIKTKRDQLTIALENGK